MPLSVFIEMTLSAILTVWSPGPNNILLLSTASKYGISGNIRFMTGIWSGSGQMAQNMWMKMLCLLRSSV